MSGGRRKISADMLIDEIKSSDKNERKYVMEIDKYDLDKDKDLDRWRKVKNNPDKYMIIDEKKSISTVNKGAVVVLEFKDFTLDYAQEKKAQKKTPDN